MKLVISLVLAAVVLASCGSVTLGAATRQWIASSDFHDASAQLASDAHTSLNVLSSPHGSASERHTICQVLFTDTSAAQSALPSPDDQANALLTTSYNALGRGAQSCYFARTNRLRTASRAQIRVGLANLQFATIRLGVVTSGP